jgi:hypothetical protein|tara:strand:+ start:864 stop:1169 length:306 start_codon:yes stop_codon:yes gene_type:complete
MSRQSANLPHVRGRSVGGSHKAWRGKSGWQDYLKAKALAAGKGATGLGANRSLANRIGGLLGWWGLPAANKIANIELKKDGGRVKGVGKAKRGFGRAMRKR